MANAMISNKQFWLCTFSLLLVWIVVLTTAVPSTSIKVNEKNCKALCQHCGCMGFYCGEECICECNDENSDTECIKVMQTNAKKLDIPFQLLIQGSSSNRFVNNALVYNQAGIGGGAAGDDNSVAFMMPPTPPHRNRRSTIVIYKPAYQNALDVERNELGKPISRPDGATSALRNKRAVGQQLDWITDFASTLVRPAPLTSSAKKMKTTAIEESKPQKRATAKDKNMDRSWFAEDNNFLLRPAPLFKPQQRSRSNGGSGGRDDYNVDRDITNFVDMQPMTAAVGKLPNVVEDTLRNIQKSTMRTAAAGDLGDNLLTQLKESTNALQTMTDNNLGQFLPSGGMLSDNLQQTLSSLSSQLFKTSNSNKAADEERIASAQPQPRSQQSPPTRPTRRMTAASKLAARPRFTWFRPVRFLHRVQQAIN